MSISPISASSLYQEQINYFLNATRTDYSDLSNLLAKYGLKSSGDINKDLQKLREIQTETAANGLQGLSEDDKTAQSTEQTVSYSWYSIMYQLGLNPTGNPKQDFINIMEVLVEGVSKRSREQFMGRTSQNKAAVFPKGDYKVGDLVKVRVVGSSSATLICELV